MRILSIGNSFSEDAHVYLYALAEQRGIDLKTVNAAISGCSLEMHWDNIANNKVIYLHNENGGEDWDEERYTLDSIIKSYEFDAVTIQQVSGLSGIYETYQPYLNDIITYVRKNQPKAKIYIHRTWAYEIDTTHGDFKRYGCDQEKMYNSIVNATNEASKETGAELIFSADVIQNLRKALPKFDYKNGGESLCRDGFHMSVYGRVAVSLTWLATLTEKKIEPMEFLDLDYDIICEICKTVNKTVLGK